MNKKFWLTAFTLTGTMIGAGILGLPYVFSKSGFLIGMFWILFFGGILIYVKLCMGEVTLRTKGIHQLPGYAKIYLGKNGKRIMFISMVFGIYSALLAYLIREGHKGLKKVEAYGVLAIIFIVVGIFLWFASEIHYENLSYFNKENFFLPLGVTLFALLGFSSIPELRREIKGSEKLLRKAIITGALISIVIYFIFTFSFVGVYGGSVGEVATLSSGRFISLLGAFTMLTSYFVLSFVLKDIFVFDLKKSKTISFVFVSVVPLILYLFVSFFKLASFVSVLGIGGVISGGLTGIMILVMSMKAKKKSRLKPSYKMPLNWITVFVLSLIFIIGCIIEIFL